MKNYFLISICMFIVLQSLSAQVKNLHWQSNKIPDSLVKEKVIGADTVKFVDQKYFKEGWNVFNIEPTIFMYIDYKKNIVRGFLLSDTSGVVKKSIFFGDNEQEIIKYWYSYCACKGEENCYRMFASGECNNNKVCVGNTCFCTTSSQMPRNKEEMIEFRRKVLEKMKAGGKYNEQ